MKRKLIIGGVLLAALVVFVVVSITRSRNETVGGPASDLNSPAQIALDECLAKADDPLHDVFVKACLNDRTIDKDPEHCDRWGSKKVLEFMNENSSYPTFKPALDAWEKEALKCSMPSSPEPTH